MKIERKSLVKIDIEMTADELQNVVMFLEFALENCMAEFKSIMRDGGHATQDITDMEQNVNEFYERL